MSEVSRIQDQLKRTYEAGAWHGASVQETLAGVTSEMAATKPGSGAHSIWEIVLHMITWMNVPRQRILDARVSPTSAEEDWPAARGSGDDAWKAALERLTEAYRLLQQTLSQLDDSQLDRIVEGSEGTSIYVLLHGVIHHNLYHAGQIAILKKVQSTK